MECELCGRESECRPAIVDNVHMMLCQNCMKYGKGITIAPSPTNIVKKPILERIRQPKEKDVYKDMTKELVPNYNILIKDGREKKGLSREELGFRIGERTVTISKIENGDLKPSDKIAQKLEKELDIKLFEEIASTPGYATKVFSGPSSGRTLGDFIKRE
jgi:putative transcription factor